MTYERLSIGDRVWVLTDDGETVRGTIMGEREMIVMWMADNKLTFCYSVKTDRGGTWPVGEDRLKRMDPLDVLAEIKNEES